MNTYMDIDIVHAPRENLLKKKEEDGRRRKTKEDEGRRRKKEEEGRRREKEEEGGRRRKKKEEEGRRKKKNVGLWFPLGPQRQAEYYKSVRVLERIIF